MGCIPERGLDRLGLLGDGDEQLVVREHRKLPMFAVPLHTLPPVRKPIRQSEVDRFVEVELSETISANKFCNSASSNPVIEACMIRLGAGYDELTGALIARIHPDTGVGDPLWVHESDELEQQVWLRLEKIGSLALDGGFKLLGVRPWDAVPCLGFTPVHLRKFVNLQERETKTKKAH